MFIRILFSISLGVIRKTQEVLKFRICLIELKTFLQISDCNIKLFIVVLTLSFVEQKLLLFKRIDCISGGCNKVTLSYFVITDGVEATPQAIRDSCVWEQVWVDFLLLPLSNPCLLKVSHGCFVLFNCALAKASVVVSI